MAVVGMVTGLLVTGCSASKEAPQLFTKKELLSFEETGRSARYPSHWPSEAAMAQNRADAAAEDADSMRIETASTQALQRGDDPVAAVIAADEERKKVLGKIDQEESVEEIAQEGVHKEVEIAVAKTIPVASRLDVHSDELPLDQSYWKPAAEEVLGEVEGAGGVRVAISRPHDNAEKFKVARGGSARLAKWFVLNEPKRLVLDFDDSVGQGFSTKHVLPMDSKFVSEVRVGAFEGRSRVVLDLADKDCSPKVLSEKNAEEVEIAFTS